MNLPDDSASACQGSRAACAPAEASGAATEEGEGGLYETMKLKMGQIGGWSFRR